MLTLLATALLFLSIWIVTAAPVAWLYPLSAGAPEVSPFLLGLSLLVFLLTLRRLSTRKVAALFALAAAAISAIPISKLSAVERAFDQEFARAFPYSANLRMPDNARARPVVARDLVTGITTGDVRVTRGLQFAAPEGRPLVLDVYRSTVEGRLPAIVQVHGGAWQRGTRTENETFARYFASRGYVVFAIEYRHAPQSRWPAALEDTRAAIAFVRRQAVPFDVDDSRLAVMGRSAGGQLALIAGYTSDAAAVVSYYGPTDLEKGWRNPPDPDPFAVRSILETFLGGMPDAIPNRYREASPRSYVSSGAPPTLLIQGTRDHVVRPEFAREFHTKLKEVGAKSMLVEIPWAEHAFDVLPNGLSGQLALYCTERFLAAALSR